MAKIILNGRKVIAKDVLIAKTVLQKMRGLMFMKKALPILLVFGSQRCWGIHSLFVFFPFDAVFVDAGGRVASTAQSIRPFTPLVQPSLPSKSILELPAGSVGKFKIRKGDNISVLL